MSKCKYPLWLFLLGLLAVDPSVLARAQSFTSADFLEFSAAGRDSYITTSASMAGVIATRNTDGQARCVDNWVAEHRANGYSAVTETMRAHPGYHPQAIILAVLQKACGSFSYTND